MSGEPKDLQGGVRDFDFLIGAWNVRHRRLQTRLSGDGRWETFGGTMRAEQILLGQGNFDENVMELPGKPYRACTIRIFHVATGKWTIHWIDGRAPKIDPPMTGAFEDGIGTFYGSDEIAGSAIDVRFLWNDITVDSAVWQQAFSNDEKRTWETNWIMEFSRA